MRHLVMVIAILTCLAAPALAADDGAPKPPAIVVSGYGSADYVPNIARLTLGVRAEAPTAAAASSQVASSAQAVVAAMRRLGIADRDMRTTGFSLYYQQPQPRPLMMTPQAGAPQSAAVQPLPNEPRRPYPTGGGTYVATEDVLVKATPAQAGNIIDAAVNAGANQSYGLSFDTSAHDALMREALARAVKNARDNADAIASAAGLHILGIQSIESGGGPPRMFAGRVMNAMAPQAAPPILEGTETVSTSVTIVFRVR